MSTKKICDSKIFIERLKSLRGDRNKAEFSRFLGIAPPVYQAYENGRLPAADNLLLISQKCGVSVDWLLGINNINKKIIVSEEPSEYIINNELKDNSTNEFPRVQDAINFLANQIGLDKVKVLKAILTAAEES